VDVLSGDAAATGIVGKDVVVDGTGVGMMVAIACSVGIGITTVEHETKLRESQSRRKVLKFISLSSSEPPNGWR